MKLLLLVPLLFLLTEVSLSKDKLSYTVTSDSQVSKVDGTFEAIGNVVIKNTNNNFEAYSNKLEYDKESKSLKLFGNVVVKNFEFEGLNIKMSSGEELTIFTETGLFEFKSSNDNRVKTNLQF